MRDRAERVRQGKYFAKKDLIIYAIVVVCVLALFLSVFLGQKKETLERIEVYYKENLIYIYDISEKNGIITESGEEFVEEFLSSDGATVVVVTPEGRNKIEFDGEGAAVTEADCSQRADCVNAFGKITSGGDAIFCIPHSLRIIGVGAGNNEVLL